MSYPIIDVSDWQVDKGGEYGAGQREKEWIINPETGKLAMFKIPREDRGEHWAEKISSELASVLGFPCASVELAVRNGKLGCLSYFFVNLKSGYSHYDGGKFFPFDYDFENNKGYNIQLIQLVLKKYELPFENLLFVVLFDALIGEGDRHQDNWGITRHEKRNTYEVSPLYDNSASLTRELPSGKVEKFLDSKDDFLRYINRSKSKMGWYEVRQEKHFLLVKKLYEQFPNEMKVLINKLHQLTDDVIKEITFKLPESMVDHNHKLIINEYIKERRNILIRIGDSMKRKLDELLLIWKDPDTRLRYKVGKLTQIEEGYRFVYEKENLKEAVDNGFSCYPGFDELDYTYEVKRDLFEGFKRRLPRKNRPDYPSILDKYGLTIASTDLEILEATAGRLPTDTFEFVRDFKYDSSIQDKVYFDLAAARYYQMNEVKEHISNGDEVILEKEPENEFDLFAVKVNYNRKHIGYVPKYYSKELTKMIDDNANYTARITFLDLVSSNPDEWVKVGISIEPL